MEFFPSAGAQPNSINLDSGRINQYVMYLHPIIFCVEVSMKPRQYKPKLQKNINSNPQQIRSGKITMHVTVSCWLLLGNICGQCWSFGVLPLAHLLAEDSRHSCTLWQTLGQNLVQVGHGPCMLTPTKSSWLWSNKGCHHCRSEATQGLVVSVWFELCDFYLKYFLELCLCLVSCPTLWSDWWCRESFMSTVVNLSWIA